MERSTKHIIGLFLIATALAGCDKTESAAQKLMKGGRWKVTEMTIGESVVDKLPKWAIDFCENETYSCTGTWEHSGGTMHPFQWQFSNFGGTFTFTPGEPISETTNMAYAQCFNFSGAYKVTKSRRNAFHLESSETYGYPGKLVIILLEKDQ